MWFKKKGKHAQKTKYQKTEHTNSLNEHTTIPGPEENTVTPLPYESEQAKAGIYDPNDQSASQNMTMHQTNKAPSESIDLSNQQPNINASSMKNQAVNDSSNQIQPQQNNPVLENKVTTQLQSPNSLTEQDQNLSPKNQNETTTQGNNLNNSSQNEVPPQTSSQIQLDQNQSDQSSNSSFPYPNPDSEQSGKFFSAYKNPIVAQTSEQGSQNSSQGHQQTNQSNSSNQNQSTSQNDQSNLTILHGEGKTKPVDILHDSSDHASNQTSPLQTPGIEQLHNTEHLQELSSDKANNEVSIFREVPPNQQMANKVSSTQVGAMNKGAGEAIQSQSSNSSSSSSNQAGKVEEVSNPAAKEQFITAIQEKTHSPADLVVRIINEKITTIYFENLIEGVSLNEHILNYLQRTNHDEPGSLSAFLAIPGVELTTDINKTTHSMLNGAVCIHVNGHSQIVLAKIPARESRGLSAPENESQVIGSQVGFNENLSTNISLVRRYIVNPNLCNEKFRIGKQTNTSVSLLYVSGIASEEQVNTVRQRISSIDVSDLIDSAILAELIEDSSISIFPQMLLTERPDRFCDGLLSGKVGIMVDGSSMGILCPQSFIEFFQSKEDSNLRWPVATFVRLLRFVAIFVSIYFTPIYVAALTFHYEVIPQQLLVPLSESRAIVPFPPILEAIFLELIIELLREAGARLPTKVGQTIGIVGGIVLGTAAVQAGITSNILIIIIALCALSSFTTPNYMMGNVIRIIRFPIIICAGFWGFYGIMLTFCFLLIHLLRQTTLGAPFLAPFYPPRLKDWPDSIIRMPLPFIGRQTINSRQTNNKQSKKD